MRVIRYVKQSAGMEILLTSKNNKQLKAFCDADWESCPNTRKSITAYLVTYGDFLSHENPRSRILYQEVQQKLNTEV